MIRIELRGALERDDRLVPLLGLDGDPSEQILRLHEIGLHLDQPLEDRARLVVGLLLDVLLGERDVGVLGRGASAIACSSSRSASAGRRWRRYRSARARRALTLVESSAMAFWAASIAPCHVLGAREPLGELYPQVGRVRVILDGQAQLRDGVLKAAVSRLHLGLGEMPVGAGRPAAEGRALHHRGRARGLDAAGLGGRAGAGAEVAQPPRTSRRPAAASPGGHGMVNHVGRLMCVLSGRAEPRRAVGAR